MTTPDPTGIREAAALHQMACEDNPGHADWDDCATTGPCRDEGQRLADLLAAHPTPPEADAGAGERCCWNHPHAAHETPCAGVVARADVNAVLALFPMSSDGTGHIADCGFGHEGPACGCYDLPARIASLLAARDAAMADRVRRETAEGGHPVCTETEPHYFPEQCRGTSVWVDPRIAREEGTR